MTEHQPTDEGGTPLRDLDPTVVGASGQSPANPERDAVLLHRVDHFALIGPIGEGGMGIVYRANDSRLNRTVAIKVLKKSRDERDNSLGRRRFVTEARITGQLQHPGIPPVHELGSLPDGRPFLAMKLVEGATLRDLLMQRSDPSSDLSRYVSIFEQICHAVGYAHTHRIIHRDLKPANVMVGGHGEVQVMDWGLAKVIGASQGEDSREDAGSPDHPADSPADGTRLGNSQLSDSGTCAGQAVGTPAYMPPEQARGEVHMLDARCDVFGLGAILCEILTGSPPYAADNLPGILLQAVRGSLGKAMERLDTCRAEPDLVALCRRCLSSRKEDRPADANAVASEVTRIRQAAETRARQAEMERAAFLVKEAEQRKRRRLLFAAALVVVGVLTVGAVGTTLGMLRAERNRRRADAAKERAVASEKRARQSERRALAERDAKTQALHQLETALAAERQARESERQTRREAMAALRFMTDGAVKDQLASGSRMAEAKSDYLNKVIEFYQRLAQTQQAHEESRSIQAEGYFRAGKLQYYVGLPQEALANLQQAVERYRSLVSANPQNAEHRLALTEALNEYSAIVRKATSDDERAEMLARQALDHALRLFKNDPHHRAYQVALAESQNNLGVVYWRTGRHASAERAFQESIEIRTRLVREFPEAAQYRNLLAGSHGNLGIVYADMGRHQEAQREYETAIEIRTQLVKQFPGVPEYRSLLAGNHSNLGIVYNVTGRLADAEREYQQTIDIQTQLTDQFPAVPAYRDALARSHHNLGVVYWRAARYRDAESEYRKGMAIQTKLVAAFPNIPGYQASLATSHSDLAVVYGRLGRSDLAAAQYGKTIRILAQLIEQFPHISSYRSKLASAYRGFTSAHLSTSRSLDHPRQLTETIEAVTPLLKPSPNDPLQHSLAGCLHLNRAMVLHRAGRPVEALKQLRQARPHHMALIRQAPQDVQAQLFWRANLRLQFLAHVELLHHDEAIDTADRIAKISVSGADADAYNVACLLARAAAELQHHPKLDPPSRRIIVARYQTEAIRHLRVSVAHGFDHVEHMKKDPDLEALRNRADFQALVTKIEAKQETGNEND